MIFQILQTGHDQNEASSHLNNMALAPAYERDASRRRLLRQLLYHRKTSPAVIEQKHYLNKSYKRLRVILNAHCLAKEHDILMVTLIFYRSPWWWSFLEQWRLPLRWRNIRMNRMSKTTTDSEVNTYYSCVTLLPKQCMCFVVVFVLINRCSYKVLMSQLSQNSEKLYQWNIRVQNVKISCPTQSLKLKACLRASVSPTQRAHISKRLHLYLPHLSR